MSDQKASVEIEDLLSSIRRLVAEDLRAPAPPPQPKPQPAQAIPPRTVAAPPRTAAPVEQARPAPDGAGMAAPPRARLTFEAAPAVVIRPAAAPTPPSHPSAAPEPVRRHVAAQEAGARPADAPALPAAPPPEPPVEYGAPRLVLSPALRVVSTSEPQAEPEPAEVEDFAPMAGFLRPGAAEPATVAQLHPSQQAFWQAETWADRGPAPAPAESRSAQPTYAPAPPLRSAQPYYQDAYLANDAAETAADWADAAEAEVLAALARGLDADEAAPQPTATVEPASPEAAPYAPAAALPPELDEDMLRELVRELIREELQGALGERITRNVRKLVRAEIARAMAIRDFE